MKKVKIKYVLITVRNKHNTLLRYYLPIVAWEKVLKRKKGKWRSAPNNALTDLKTLSTNGRLSYEVLYLEKRRGNVILNKEDPPIMWQSWVGKEDFIKDSNIRELAEVHTVFDKVSRYPKVKVRCKSCSKVKTFRLTYNILTNSCSSCKSGIIRGDFNYDLNCTIPEGSKEQEDVFTFVLGETVDSRETFV